jgi:hypothetical protein
VGKAHVTAKFVDGNGLIALLAIAGADDLHDAAGRTVALAGNTADIFRVYDASFQRHNQPVKFAYAAPYRVQKPISSLKFAMFLACPVSFVDGIVKGFYCLAYTGINEEG